MLITALLIFILKLSVIRYYSIFIYLTTFTTSAATLTIKTPEVATAIVSFGDVITPL